MSKTKKNALHDDERHEVGDHIAGIKRQRINNLMDKVNKNLQKNYGEVICGCDVIREVMKVAKTKEEVAVLSFAAGQAYHALEDTYGIPEPVSKLGEKQKVVN